MCTNRQMESVKVQHSTETPPTESCPSVSNKCQSANNICHRLLPLRHLASSASYLSMSPLSRAFLSRSFSYLRFHSSAVNSSFTITEFLIVLALYKAETKKIWNFTWICLWTSQKCHKTPQVFLHERELLPIQRDKQGIKNNNSNSRRPR